LELTQSETIQVTGDGHRGIGHSGVSRSAFGNRLPWPMAEQPPPESPTAVAVIRHLEFISIR
jgi:hypothetical protein